MPLSDEMEYERGTNLELIVRVSLPAQAAAGADSTTHALFDERGANPSGDTAVTQQDATEVISAYYVPSAAVTGQATNYASVQLVELDGTGAYVSTLAALDFNAGTVAATANGPIAIPGAAGKTVPAGHSLAVREHQTGTGLALPAGSAQFGVARQSIN